MSRVSENSGSDALTFAVNRIKSKYEDLQLKGTNLKKLLRISDNPSGNSEVLQLKSQKIENDQYKKNISYAMTFMEISETSLKEVIEVLNKAKEIAIAQASDFYNPAIRRTVAEEVGQLEKRILGVANRKMGNRYIFGGHQTLDRPFDREGNYKGDPGLIQVEVQKDFFVPMNLPGDKIFYMKTDSRINEQDPLDLLKRSMAGDNTETAPVAESTTATADASAAPDAKNAAERPIKTIFSTIRSIKDALITSNTAQLQNSLEEIDEFHDQVLNLMTHFGSIYNTLNLSQENISQDELTNATRKSFLEDADVVELFSDLQRQDLLLKASYKTGAKILNENLLDFLR